MGEVLLGCWGGRGGSEKMFQVTHLRRNALQDTTVHGYALEVFQVTAFILTFVAWLVLQLDSVAFCEVVPNAVPVCSFQTLDHV